MIKVVWLALVTALLAGCGSGGGGNAVEPGASVDFGTRAASNQTVVYAVEFVLHLPAGVTLPADPATGELPAGVLLLTDSRAVAAARYQPATATAQALVKVNIADPGGFAVGELGTLDCAVPNGTAIGAAGFSLDGFSARDANGAAIAGITPYFAVRPR